MKEYKPGDLVEFKDVIYKLVKPAGPYGWYARDGNDVQRIILTEYFKPVKSDT